MKIFNNRMSIIKLPDINNLESVEKYLEAINCVLLSLSMTDNDLLSFIDKEWDSIKPIKTNVIYLKSK